ncbi:MAG: hypothetical protein EKK55_20130 [Rhodocyclaceae bacterium]|nr:MAG: hypothetical protein EKK55_20130 [Rhodocyclaceae bacterium]
MATEQTSPATIYGETATHYLTRVTTSRGYRYEGKWAKDSAGRPSNKEILLHWDEETMGGRVKSGNWRRV